MDLQLQTTTPKAAEQMLDLAKGAVAMAKMSPEAKDSLPVDLDKVLQLSSSGNLVRATVSIDQAEVEKIMASVKMPGAMTPKPGPVQSAAAPAAVPVPVPVPAAKPAEPVRKTVWIYGLPGGPKEVPVQ